MLSSKYLGKSDLCTLLNFMYLFTYHMSRFGQEEKQISELLEFRLAEHQF